MFHGDPLIGGPLARAWSAPYGADPMLSRSPPGHLLSGVGMYNIRYAIASAVEQETQDATLASGQR